jgi:hypothetical protein
LRLSVVDVVEIFKPKIEAQQSISSGTFIKNIVCLGKFVTPTMNAPRKFI